MCLIKGLGLCRPGGSTDVSALTARVEALEDAVGDATLLSGSADPSAGAGVAATQPALYIRTTGGVSTLYLKTGTANTAWTLIVTQSFSGDITASRFLGSALGSNAAPTFSWADDPNTGIYSEGADIVSAAAGGTRYWRIRSAGVDTLNTLLTSMHQFALTNEIRPTALSANANDYNPTGLGAAAAVLQDATTDVSVTGLAGGTDGRVLLFVNVSASTITLEHEDANSTAGNRFSAPGTGAALPPRTGAILLYDSTTSRWRVWS